MKKLVGLFVASCASLCLWAETRYFAGDPTNTQSFAWSKTANWQSSAVPGAGDRAVLGSAPYVWGTLTELPSSLDSIAADSDRWIVVRSDNGGSATNPGDLSDFMGTLTFITVGLGMPWTFSSPDANATNRLHRLRAWGAPVVTVAVN